MQKIANRHKSQKENLQGILMQLWKNLDRKNRAKKHLKTTKDGPRDPCAIFRKIELNGKSRKKTGMHSHNNVQKLWCNLNML